MRIRFIIIALLFNLLSPALYAQDKDSKPILKVLTFNIYHGETMNHDFDLDRIAQVIIESEADIVALQEVDFKTNRAKKYDLVTELAFRCQMQGIFGKAMNYDGGEYGEGVLSKISFYATHNHALPYSEGNEPRAALETILILQNGDTLSFIGTHFDHLEDPRDRILQANKINQIFAKTPYPSILAGDLNDQPNSDAIEILKTFWTPSYDPENMEYTYPSDQANKKIDYIMFYPEHKWRVIESKTICDEIASDHCAYLVSLELLK